MVEFGRCENVANRKNRRGENFMSPHREFRTTKNMRTRRTVVAVASCADGLETVMNRRNPKRWQ